MDRNNIAKFIDEQIEENARDLRNIQIKVQKYEQILVLCLSMYLKSSLSFDFLLKASLSGFFKDTRFDYIAFQKARINYNNSNNCKRLIEDVAICIKTSKKLEKIIGEFVGIDNFKLFNANEAGNKIYKYLYNYVRENITLPKEYFDCYMNNEKALHFYTKEELQGFLEKFKHE